MASWDWHAGSSFKRLGASWGPTLERLTILGCRFLTDAALQGIGRLTGLTFLRMEDCSSQGRRHGGGGPFTDEGLACLASCTQLTAVNAPAAL